MTQMFAASLLCAAYAITIRAFNGEQDSLCPHGAYSLCEKTDTIQVIIGILSLLNRAAPNLKKEVTILEIETRI